MKKYELECIHCKEKFIGEKGRKFCRYECSVLYKIHSKRFYVNGVEYKTCSKCKNKKPNNIKFYHKKSKSYDGLSHTCKTCTSEEQKEKYNKTENKLKLNLYIQQNKEILKKRRREYYLKNRQKEIDRAKKYNKENKEHIRKKSMEYRKTEKGFISNKLKTVKRRTRLKNAINNFTVKDWEYCLKFFDSKCAYCGSGNKITVEHFIPVEKNGNTTIDNIIPACSSCNSSKQNKDFYEWYENKDFYSKERIEKIQKYFENFKDNTEPR